MKKVFGVFFVILCIVTLIELLIYFVLNRNSTNRGFLSPLFQSSPKSNPTVNPDVVATPTLFISPLIRPEYVNSLLGSESDPNLKVLITTHLNVKISSISDEDFIQRGVLMKYSLNYINYKGYTTSISFSENLFNKTKVYSQSSTQTTPITIDDLKVGDSVRIIQTIDPSLPPQDPNQTVSYEIYRFEL